MGAALMLDTNSYVCCQANSLNSWIRHCPVSPQQLACPSAVHIESPGYSCQVSHALLKLELALALQPCRYVDPFSARFALRDPVRVFLAGIQSVWLCCSSQAARPSCSVMAKV